MTRFYVFSIVLLLSVSFSVGKETNTKIEFDVSDFIDRANPLIAAAIVENNLDPLKIPNVTKTIALSTVTLSNGYLHDLSKIRRNLPATLTYQNKQLTFFTGLEIKNVTLYADYDLKRVWTKRHGKVTAYASPLDIKIGMHFDLNTLNFTLTTFDVKEIKKIKVNLTGNNNSDWIVNAITNAATSLLNKYIKQTISSEVSTVIQDFLNKFGRQRPNYTLLL